MKAAVCCLGLMGMVLVAGCETTSKTPVPDAAAAVLPATDEQRLLAKNRATLIYGRWSEEDRTKFVRKATPFLAVKTLSLTPEQIATLGGKVPAPESATCVVIWDAKAEKVVGSECYIVPMPPARGLPARFGVHTAQYIGSL